MITSVPERVAELRERLMSLSWFMRCVDEPIARAANAEDNCSGHFWEGRFRSQELLDDAAVLACSVYVDLNPVRAEVARTPEESQFTSAFDRIQALRAGSDCSADGVSFDLPEPREASTASVGPGATAPADSWLCALTLVERPSAVPGAPDSSQEVASGGTALSDEPTIGPRPRARQAFRPRASDQGYLPLELTKYLSLLDWTGRELRAGKRGVIPDQLAPILERLAVDGEGWVETVRNFGRWFSARWAAPIPWPALRCAPAATGFRASAVRIAFR